MPYSLPIVKIEPYGLMVTEQHYYDDYSGIAARHNRSNFDSYCSKEYSTFSTGARKRLKRAFHLLLAISEPQSFYDVRTDRTVKFTLNFITLTLSAAQGIVTDYKIKQLLLNHFLTVLRQKKGLKHYLWRAESQKNGNIHFHICTNMYLNFQFIRDEWNNVQKKLGFIDLFNEKHHHIDPNSTDVHSVFKIKNSGAYVAKYLRKTEENSREIKGKIWDCSKSLKPKECCIIPCYDEDFNILQAFEKRVEHKKYTGEHYTFYNLSSPELRYYLPPQWLEQYNSYLNRVKIAG